MEEIPSSQEVAESIDELTRNAKLENIGDTLKYRKQKQYEQNYKLQYQLIRSIWEEEKIPQLWWKTAAAQRMRKSKRSKICTSCSFISVLNMTYKILANILLRRLTPYFNKNIRTSTLTEQVFMLRQILERCWEYNIPLYQVYVVFNKSYKSITQELITSVLTHFSIPAKVIDLIQLTVRKIHYRLDLNGELTINFLKYQGLREKEVLSPFLLDILSEYAIRQLNIRNKYLFHSDVQFLHYGNEVAVVSLSMEKSLQVTSEFNYNLQLVGLGINKSKTKFLITSRNAAIQRSIIGRTVQVDSFKIDVVDRVKFLGTLVTDSNDLLNEVKCRLTDASKLFKTLKETGLSHEESLGMYKKIIRPIAIYGSQAWILSSQCLHLLKRFEEQMFRIIFDMEHKKKKLRDGNDLRKMVTEPDITSLVRRGRLLWLGHIIRTENLMTKNLISKPKQKRFRGRPRLRWRDCVFRDVNALTKSNFKAFISGQKKWKNSTKKKILSNIVN